MITKVSYRPYALGVNNRQNQPQNVNFGMKLTLTERELDLGDRLIASMVGCFSAGRANRIDLLPTAFGEVFAVLRSAGGDRLADATAESLRQTTNHVERIIGETVAEMRCPDSLMKQAGARVLNCLKILSDSSYPNSKTKALLDMLSIFQQHPRMTLEDLNYVIAEQLATKP